MRCKKLRKLSYKYIDDQLSEREKRIIEEHIRDCTNCAVEVDSLKKMRSLLHSAGEVHVSDEYWDTYWERLERKLPDEPPSLSLASRVLDGIVELIRRPAVLGRVALYILLLALLIHTISDEPWRFHTRWPASSSRSFDLTTPDDLEVKSYSTERGLRARLKGIEVETPVATGGRPIKEEHPADSVHKTAETMAGLKERDSDKPAQAPAAREELAPEAGLSVSKEAAAPAEELARFSWAKPTKPAAPEATLAAQEDKKGSLSLGYELTNAEDEYISAEKYFKEGEYAQAIPAYQNFIIANTITGAQDDLQDYRILKARYQLGEANFQIGNYSEALSNFTVVANEGSQRRSGQAGAEGEVESTALAPVKPVRGAEADRREVEYGRAELRRRGRRDTDFPQTHEEMLSNAIFRQAQSYEYLGESKEALSAYEKYVKSYPQGKYTSQARGKIDEIRAGIETGKAGKKDQ